MPLTRIFGLGLSVVMVVTVLSSASSAQIKRPLRWMGQGFSDGYHRCAPGPNSDYYNPYSAHNSLLISQQPTTSNVIPMNENGTTKAIRIGVPYSGYAAPYTVKNSPTTKSLPLKIIDNSFVPFQRGPISTTDNDWSTPPINTDQDVKTKDDSAFLHQSSKRLRQRFANGHFFPRPFLNLNR